MNKKMLLSVLIIGVVAVSAGAGTWAVFSDKETSTGNTMTAGTLDLNVDGDDSLEIMTITDLAPNAMQSDTTVVKNVGSLDGKLELTFSALVDSNPTQTEPETVDETDTTPDDGNCDGATAVPVADKDAISKYTQVTVKYGPTGSEAQIAQGTLANLVTGGAITLDDTMTQNEENNVILEFLLDPADPDTTGNVFQGDQSSFTVTFDLSQV